MNYEKLSKKAIGSMYAATLIGTSIIVITLSVLLLIIIPKDLIIVRYIVWGVIAMSIINFLIGPPVRYNRYRYLINEECIDVKEGFIFIERQIVPIERLLNIEISKGPVNRLFGLAVVKVTTAGSTVPIKYLEDKKADFIVESLQKRINAVALEKKRVNIQNAEEVKTDTFSKSQEEDFEVKDLEKQIKKDTRED
jgi:membrane protein YdbS with pleckstrin-like domain